MVSRVSKAVLLSVTYFGFLASVAVQAADVPPGFSDLVKKALPAVVNIAATDKIAADNGVVPGSPEPPGMSERPLRTPMDELLQEFSKGRQQPQPSLKVKVLGSGFIIDPDGYIVTSNHVIEAGKKITLTLSDGRQFQPKRIGADPATDLALLKIDAPEPLPYLEWGSSQDADVGDWVIAIGSPFGLGGSVSAGLLSGRARDIQAGPYDDFLQTDAAINRGHSGGPLFNAEGKIIGVNTAILSSTGGNIGISFAIPASTAAPIIAQLRESGTVRRGMLGVQVQVVTNEIADAIGLRDSRGAMIASIVPGSPASKIDLKPGDVILRYDGREIDSMRSLPRHVSSTGIGKVVKMKVWRDGRTIDREATIAEQLSAQVPNDREEDTPPPKEENTTLGMRLEPLDDSLKTRLGLEATESGVLVTSVSPESEAAAQGIEAGDVISEVNKKPVTDPGDLMERMKEAKKAGRSAALLRIKRSGEYRFVALPV